MANLTTSKDLIEDALRKAGEKIDGTSLYEADVLAYMNKHYSQFLAGSNVFDVDLGDPWTWAKAQRPGTLTLKPPYTSTVTLTSGSTAAALGAAPSYSLDGWFLKIDNLPEFFQISQAIAGDLAITLDSAYTESSGAVNCTLYKLEYTLLSGILRLISPLIVYRVQDLDSDYEGKIYMLDENTLTASYPLSRLQSGIPTHCAISKDDGQGQLSLRMNFVPSVDTKVEYNYIPFPTALSRSDSSIPLIPLQFRQVLSYATAWSICAEKEDDKSKVYYTMTKAELVALAKHTHKQQLQTNSKERGKLTPRMDNQRIKRWPILG